MSNYDYPMCQADTCHPEWGSTAAVGGLGCSNQTDLESAYKTSEKLPLDETLRNDYKALLNGTQTANDFGGTVNMDYGHADLPQIKWPTTNPGTSGEAVAASSPTYAGELGQAGGPSSPFTPNFKSPGASSTPGTTNLYPSDPSPGHLLPGYLATRPPGSGDGTAMDPSTSSPHIGEQNFKDLIKGSS